jgi:DnaJ-class molecular chaperone
MTVDYEVQKYMISQACEGCSGHGEYERDFHLSGNPNEATFYVITCPDCDGSGEQVRFEHVSDYAYGESELSIEECFPDAEIEIVEVPYHYNGGKT